MNENNTTPYRLTPFETFIKYLVLFFIWFGIWFVPSFIIGALKGNGIILGMIPTLLIYSPFCYFCKKASEKWFKYYKAKRIKKQQSKTSNEKLRLPDGCHSIVENSTEECSEGQEADIPSSTESSAKLNYKEAKKAARQEFKEKKKELKTTYPKQTKNKYKIATIILSILLFGATIVNIAQFIYYEEEISNLKYENLGLSIEIGDLEIIIESLEEQVENLSDDEKWSIDDIDLSEYEIIW